MLTKNHPAKPQDAVRKYLHEALGVDPAIRQWAGVHTLPYFLQDAFELYELTIRDLSFLLAVNRREKTLRLAMVRGQMDKIKSLADRPVVYVTDALASYERKRLIEQKVPFIVPGNQLYLPDLGIDLREYFRQKTQSPEHALSPATQAMLIKALLDKSTQTIWHPAATAAEVGYTPMTLSRAVKELTTAGIATLQRRGKARWLHMNRSPAETWDVAKPLLRSPVKRSVWTHPNPVLLQPEQQFPLAGLSALARYSRLAEPAQSIYAVDLGRWKTLTQRGLPTLPEPLFSAFQLQVWTYTLVPVPDEKIVDPLSLTLSLQNESDERVQGALEELQEQFPW
jgi:hypothetical protein